MSTKVVVNSRQKLPSISIVRPSVLNLKNRKSEIAFTLSFVLCIIILTYALPENNKNPHRRFLKTIFPTEINTHTHTDSAGVSSIIKNKTRPKRRKLHRSHYNTNAYPSFSYPYQQYYGAYNYMGGSGYGASSYYQYPNGGMPFYQRPAVPYGGQMTSPIFNYGYQHIAANNMNMPTQIQIPQILTMPSVGSALGYGRSTFIQQPEIGGTGTQNAVSGPGRGQTGPGLQGIIGSLTSEGGLLDTEFLGSLARLFLDGNLETLAVSVLDIITRIGEGEEVGSVLGDLTSIIFTGFLDGVIPGLGGGGGGSGSSNSGLMGELLNIIGNLDVNELGNIELPLSPPPTLSPNILDALLERFGMEAELGAPEVVEREARNRFKSAIPPPIAQTQDGKKIALVTLDDILNHFSPSEKLTVAKLRTVLFIRYQISNPDTANEYIQFILKNEIPVIGAHIPGAPIRPTPLEFYEFTAKKSGDLTFKDIMKILELFYDVHDTAAAESIALALEKLGIDIVGYNLGSSRERASYTFNAHTNTHTTSDLSPPSTLPSSASGIKLLTPPKSKSRLAYGPNNPSKSQFLALFPNPNNISTNDIREVLKFYYNVFDEETVIFVKHHMIRRWSINVN